MRHCNASTEPLATTGCGNNRNGKRRFRDQRSAFKLVTAFRVLQEVTKTMTMKRMRDNFFICAGSRITRKNNAIPSGYGLSPDFRMSYFRKQMPRTGIITSKQRFKRFRAVHGERRTSRVDTTNRTKQSPRAKTQREIECLASEAVSRHRISLSARGVVLLIKPKALKVGFYESPRKEQECRKRRNETTQGRPHAEWNTISDKCCEQGLSLPISS